MKQKIICSECETLLEPGEDPPVFKKCIKCVIETTPGADLSKIVDSGRRTFESQRPKPNPKKRPAVKQAFDNFYRGDAKYPTPIALFAVADYEKRNAVDFGLDFDQVKDIYDTMCEMNRQNKILVDEHYAKLEKDDEIGYSDSGE